MNGKERVEAFEVPATGKERRMKLRRRSAADDNGDFDCVVEQGQLLGGGGGGSGELFGDVFGQGWLVYVLFLGDRAGGLCGSGGNEGVCHIYGIAGDGERDEEQAVRKTFSGG